MGIDERLEALTQSVELLAGMQIETEKRLNLLISTVNRNEENTARLIKLAASHEERLDDHAERLGDLEGKQ